MNEDNELLRRYVEDGSEAAFAELTQRHLNLVYSAALRQLGGNKHLAEEVSQTVFLDLARKARSLLKHTSVSGWLFSTTRYAAMNLHRSESRRQAREQKAGIPFERGSDNEWLELCPVLDEAMHELPSKDREALLLRFFEGNPLAAIGARLGITESGARMRIERALEKLRNALGRRGVAVTAAGLITLLSTRSVEAAPTELTEHIQTRLGSIQPRGTNPFWSAKALAVAVTVLVLSMVSLLFQTRFGTQVRSAQESSGASTDFEPRVTPGTPRIPNLSNAVSVAGLPPDGLDGARIQIRTVNARSGEPMGNISLELVTFAGEKRNQTTAITSQEGVAFLPLPAGVSNFDLSTRGDGHANARLLFRPDRGEQIPESYTFRLTQAVPIGGTILDPDAAPVAGAKVSFGHQDAPELEKKNESHAYRYAETLTDSAGRWRIDRIAPEMLVLSSGSARHPEFEQAPYLELKDHLEELPSLTNLTYVFRLGRTIAIKGFVLNEGGEPVPGAKVSSDHLGSAMRRETVSRDDGGFLLLNVAPGRSFLTAKAEGYAPTSIPANLKDIDGPYELRLSRGKALRFRVVDPLGKGIPGARLWLEQPYHTRFGLPNQPVPAELQINLTLTTDSEGRTVWTNAPDALLSFGPSAKGFMSGRSILVRPSEQEHLVQLEYALTIRGSVHDAAGNPVPRYRIGAGWPDPIYGSDKMIPRWSEIDRFWLTFSRPTFEHTFEEPVIISPQHRGYFLRFEAEGFVPAISRLIQPHEREVTLEISLEPAVDRDLLLTDSEGQPVSGAPVLFLQEGRFAVVDGTGFQERHDPVTELRTDQHGKVRVPVDPDLARMLVVCPQGTADLLMRQLPANGVVGLRPWGQVHGQVFREETPSPGELIVMARPESLEARGSLPRPMPPLVFNPESTRTDANGRFVFTNVPPGESVVVVVQHLPGGNGQKEAIHEWKQRVSIENAEPIELTIRLPQSSSTNLVVRQ